MKARGLFLIPALIALSGCTVSHTDATGASSSGQAEVRATGTPVTAEEVREKAGEAIDVTSAYMNQERVKMQADISATLKTLDEKIADLKLRADQASGEQKFNLDRERADLQARKTDLEKLRDQAADTGQSAWKAMKENWKRMQADIQEKVREHQAAETEKDGKG
jgi:hypothetical protein